MEKLRNIKNLNQASRYTGHWCLALMFHLHALCKRPEQTTVSCMSLAKG